MRNSKINYQKTRRGDTIIEVTLAFAIFSMVAILTVAMMNSGLSASERTLELVTARNELNAQAEALRFVHSSYISELKLPTCAEVDAGEKCQQYANLWNRIENSAVTASEFKDHHIDYPLANCQEVYDKENQLLRDNNAFVLNARALTSTTRDSSWSLDDAFISASARVNGGSSAFIFQEPTLNARIIYTNKTGDTSSTSTDDEMSALSNYVKVARVEGLWVVAVEGPSRNGKAQYYDFYIETCWNGTNTSVPTSLDTVIRLYNPDGA